VSGSDDRACPSADARGPLWCFRFAPLPLAAILQHPEQAQLARRHVSEAPVAAGAGGGRNGHAAAFWRLFPLRAASFASGDRYAIHPFGIPRCRQHEMAGALSPHIFATSPVPPRRSITRFASMPCILRTQIYFVKPLDIYIYTCKYTPVTNAGGNEMETKVVSGKLSDSSEVFALEFRHGSITIRVECVDEDSAS
jgi:hypothetical protein